MSIYADSNYSFNPWMRPERRVGDEVDPTPFLTAEDTIMAMYEQSPIPPPAGVTPRLGYEDREPTIDDVFNIGAFVAAKDTPTRQDSGMPGTLGPALGHL